MDQRQTLTALLPPPRDDEPASLRQDIIDELGDHLTCAYNRELLRGADSNGARQRVLERFGDPAALARRLWFDAMKGKIMAQRVMIATCLVVMLCCGACCGVGWNWMNQERLLRTRESAAAIEANRRMAETLAQAQATNKDMLNKLGEMSEAIRHPVSADWNPLDFRLTEESADGPAAVGVSVTLSRMVGPAVADLNRTSDESGIADFGAVQPGDYKFRLKKSWPKGEFITAGDLNVRPATEIHKSIICPKAPPEKVSVRIKCTWPAELEMAGLVVYAPFKFVDRSFGPKLPWMWNEIWSPEMPEGFASSPQRFPATRSILRGAKGTTSFEIVDLAGLHLWKDPGSKETFGDILDRDLRVQVAGEEELNWEPGTYRFAELVVVRPFRGQDVEKGRRRFDVLASICSPGFGHMCETEGKPPGAGIIGMLYPQVTGAGYYDAWHRESRESAPVADWSKVADKFEAQPGQVNEWTIRLPDELIAALRTALKAEAAANAKRAGPAARDKGTGDAALGAGL